MRVIRNGLARMALVTCFGLCILLPGRADETVGQGPWVFDPIFRLFGADLGVGYRGLSLFPGQQTTFWVYGGGGYEGEHYYRDAAGNILSPGQIGSGGG